MIQFLRNSNNFSVFLLFSHEICLIMEKRQILRLMIMFLFFCNTLVTMNMNVAIISMARPFQEIEADTYPVKIAVCPNTTFLGDQTDEDKNISYQDDTYMWSNYEKRMVLSAYHWLTWLSILPGSILAQKFGSKIVVGCTLCISTAMSSIIPFAAAFGANTVMGIRMVQGFFSFIAVPAGIYTIIGNWSSEGDRGRFMSMFIVGSALGAGPGGYIFGYIGQYLHWKYIFYLTSISGFVWTVFWYFLICDNPDDHPTICIEEKTKILKSRTHLDGKVEIPVPWKDILTSIPVIVCSINYAAPMINFVIAVTFIPLYLQDMYGIDSTKSGIILCWSLLLCALITAVFAWFIDHFIKKQFLSLTNSRKLINSISILLISLPLLLMAFIKCNLPIIIILLTICTGSRGLIMFGIFPVIVDMSPKFCGILEGIMGTEAEIITLVITSGVSYLSENLSVEEFWRVVFLTTSGIGLMAVITFIIWGSAEIQPWNEGSRKYRQKNNNGDDIGSIKLLKAKGRIMYD